MAPVRRIHAKMKSNGICFFELVGEKGCVLSGVFGEVTPIPLDKNILALKLASSLHAYMLYASMFAYRLAYIYTCIYAI